MIKTCQLWDPALSICSLRIMWLIWENDWDHIGEYQSPHLKGALNCNFIKKIHPNKRRGGVAPDSARQNQWTIKGQRWEITTSVGSLPVYTVCDIKKGRDWVIQSGPWRKGFFFFSCPNACALGFIIDYPCWAIWGKHLSHLKTCHGIKSG